MPSHVALAFSSACAASSACKAQVLSTMCSATCWAAQGSLWQRFCKGASAMWQLPEVRALLQAFQVVASMLFVVLYVWSTYSTPAPGSLRYNADMLLCAVFAAEFIARFVVRRPHSTSMNIAALVVLDQAGQAGWPCEK